MTPNDEFALVLEDEGIAHEREFPFAKSIGRKFRLDFFIAPDVGVEIDGGVWTGGRHGTGAGIMTDSEKYSLAAGMGIRLVRGTPKHVKNGKLLEWVRGAINFKRQEVQR